MQEALIQAEYAYAAGEVPVGAIVVDTRNHTVVAAACNAMLSACDPTAHAELLAIREACRRLGTPRLMHCDLYVTLEPCPMCAQAISFARIRRLYFGAYDPKGGGVEHGATIFSASSCHHRPEVYGGIEENASRQLLQRFFQARR